MLNCLKRKPCQFLAVGKRKKRAGGKPLCCEKQQIFTDPQEKKARARSHQMQQRKPSTVAQGSRVQSWTCRPLSKQILFICHVCWEFPEKMTRQKSVVLNRILHLSIMYFCSPKLLPFYIPKAGLHFVFMIFFFFTTAFYRVCKPMPPHTYTTSYTHIYLYDQNGKKTNTFFLKGCSVNSSFTTWFSKKENTLRIKEECMYKMAYRIIRLNGMHLHKNENGPTWQFLVVSSLEYSVQ